GLDRLRKGRCGLQEVGQAQPYAPLQPGYGRKIRRGLRPGIEILGHGARDWCSRCCRGAQE
ncbi:unnamed protein product, partial [Symbiodinium necroappetens]